MRPLVSRYLFAPLPHTQRMAPAHGRAARMKAAVCLPLRARAPSRAPLTAARRLY